jgi:tRNA 2-selenouridine synthase
MIERIDDISPASLERFDDVVDVRSPSEFAEDRIPGAVNLPVLDNDERAEVGTIYAQVSRFKARRLGAALVANNVARHLDGPLAEKGERYRPLLYCWRGGMRSNAMATILSQIGWRVGVLVGGYRTWRRAVVADLQGEEPLNIVLLDGQTGTAKSEVLRRLPRLGVQTLDLEALARHRGSVFGGLPAPQPSQKLFESELYSALCGFDLSRPIVVEAESSLIGRLTIPKRVWRAMRPAPRIELRADAAERARFLVTAYADFLENPAAVARAIERLRPFHSKETIETWLALAAARDYEPLAAALIQTHYDPLYERGRKRRADAPFGVIEIDRLGDSGLAEAAERASAILARLFPEAAREHAERQAPSDVHG